MLTAIYRLSIRRSLPSIVLCAKTIKHEVFVVGEFGDKITLPYVPTIHAQEVGSTEWKQVSFVLRKTAEGYSLAYEWTEPGVYTLRISASTEEPGVLLLDYLTELIEFRTSSESIVPSAPTLSNQRDISIGTLNVRIRENYGELIGSHVWDSAVVLIRYLSSMSWKKQVEEEYAWLRGSEAMEMGAGCGLVSLYVASAQYGCHPGGVWCTDRAGQLPLLRVNLELNASLLAGTAVHVAALDWTEDQLPVESQRVSVIYAADVLYAYDSVAALFRTVDRLLPSSRGLAVIAQKQRQTLGADEEFPWRALARSHGFDCALLHSEALVRVWAFQRTPLLRTGL